MEDKEPEDILQTDLQFEIDLEYLLNRLDASKSDISAGIDCNVICEDNSKRRKKKTRKLKSRQMTDLIAEVIGDLDDICLSSGEDESLESGYSTSTGNSSMLDSSQEHKSSTDSIAREHRESATKKSSRLNKRSKTKKETNNSEASTHAYGKEKGQQNTGSDPGVTSSHNIAERTSSEVAIAKRKKLNVKRLERRRKAAHLKKSNRIEESNNSPGIHPEVKREFSDSSNLEPNSETATLLIKKGSKGTVYKGKKSRQAEKLYMKRLDVDSPKEYSNVIK
ncbi:uncharacterized protein PRCAT00005318001 [Priceomyces carsonii]|uniref:uncharacterized protein n=1 Tax=Priceomyces carsonii TaxID=28549 RepID=UPI002ED991CF|nr:unnamed protein product [Priceomyces carsonii]